MAFLKKFFQSQKKIAPWQDPELSIRKAAVAELTDIETLKLVIETEKNTDVLLAATKNIDTSDVLDSLCQHENSKIRQQAKQQRLQQILPSTSNLDQVSDSGLLERIAELTEDSELRLRAIEKITDDQKRLNIVLNSPVAKVRLAAAQGISDTSKLQEIMLFAQNKDKSLYRECKQQLDSVKQRQQNKEAEQQAVQQLLDSSAHLTKQAYSPDYNGRLQLLKKQLQERTSQCTAEQKSAIESNLNTAESVVTANAEAERQLQQQKKDQQDAANTLESVISQLTQLTEETLPAQEVLADQIKQVEQQWHEAIKLVKADRNQNKQYENALQAILMAQKTQTFIAENTDVLDKAFEQTKNSDGLSQLDKCKKELIELAKQTRWPAIASPAPKVIAQLEQAIEDCKEKSQQLLNNEKSAIDIAKTQLDEFAQAIKEGQTKSAAKIQSKLQKQLKNISFHKQKPLQKTFRQLQAELNEIRDWQGFASTPKKEALCEAMEALIGADIIPNLLADKIHDLQNEWKTLGQAQNDKELWDRFHTAAEKAYEPCRNHFGDIAQQRQVNLAQRQQLISQLTEYEQTMDWASADWKTVQKTLEAARVSFKSYSPVDRANHKESVTKFSEICDKIYSHIKEEYDRNIAAKELIISSIETLVEHEDLDFAIEQTKQQQEKWKTVGVTPHKAEQALWKKLRAACDAVFARRQEQRSQHKAEIQATIEQAEAVVQQAEAAAESTDTAAQQTLQDQQKAFAEFQLPKGPYQKLRQRLSKAQDRQHGLISQANAEQQKQTWTDLVSALTTKATGGEVSVKELPTGINTQLFSDNSETDETQLRTCCIAVEIIADITSPNEDKSARMEYQVQRLANNMGQGKTARDEVIEQINTWLMAGANAQWQERFNQGLNQLIESGKL